MLIMANWVSARCTKNVASAAKVGQADGVKCGRLGVGRMYKRFGKCCKEGTGQWVLTMVDWVSAGCTKNVASVAKVGQADGVKYGRLSVSWMYKKFGKCCKEGMGQWVLIMVDWVLARCTKNVASVAKRGQADGC